MGYAIICIYKSSALSNFMGHVPLCPLPNVAYTIVQSNIMGPCPHQGYIHCWPSIKVTVHHCRQTLSASWSSPISYTYTIRIKRRAIERKEGMSGDTVWVGEIKISGSSQNDMLDAEKSVLLYYMHAVSQLFPKSPCWFIVPDNKLKDW